MDNKKKLTPAELSAIRSAAGRKGGSMPKKGRPKLAKVQMQVRRADRDVHMQYASKKSMTMTDAFHYLMRVVLKNNPDITRPDDWIE